MTPVVALNQPSPLARSVGALEQRVRAELDWKARLRRDGPRFAAIGGAAIVLAPVLAATSPGWVLSGRGLAVTAYLGLVTTAAAYLLYGRGLRTVTAPVAVTLGLAEPVVAAVLGVLVPGERLTGPALAGLVLVGVAIAILTVGRPPQTARMSNSPPG